MRACVRVCMYVRLCGCVFVWGCMCVCVLLSKGTVCYRTPFKGAAPRQTLPSAPQKRKHILQEDTFYTGTRRSCQSHMHSRSPPPHVHPHAPNTQVLRRLRSKTQGIYPALESVDWRLHVQVLNRHQPSATALNRTQLPPTAPNSPQP